MERRDFVITSALCEYAADPRGLETETPRFTFSAPAVRCGQRQAAYRILVAASPEELNRGEGSYWDSGFVESPHSLNIPYGGRPLGEGDTLYWQACIRDDRGETTPMSAPARFVMGLTGGFNGSFMGFAPGYGEGAAYMRRRLRIDKPVAKAVCHIGCAGLCELYVNGVKVDDSVLDPAVTEYSKRVLYRTHVVTDLLRQGDNAFLAVLGRGWHGAPSFLFRLDVTHGDGTTLRLTNQNDSMWQHGTGPVTRNSLYNGESYDARLEGVAEEDGAIVSHRSLSQPGRPEPQVMEPIKVVGDHVPVSMNEPKPGVYVFDLGQNIAGWAKLRVRGEAGAKVSMRFAETLYADGTVNQENLRSARALDEYTLRGDPSGEEWEPRFTYHGFRYVQVEGYPGVPESGSVTGRRVRSAVAETGRFSSSNELLNRIHDLVHNTEQNNLHGIPTDCPQRDERQGWLNDMTARMESALYMFRLPLLYNKWLDDVSDTQDETGAIADTAPYVWGARPADPVSTSYLLLAWHLHQFYGDRTAIEDHFEGFKAWEDCLLAHSKDRIVQYSHYGDWCPPVAESVNNTPISAATPGTLMSTGYLYYNAVLLSRMAGILGREGEQRRYERLAGEVREAFNRAFYHPETGQYGNGGMAAGAFALYLGIVPPGEEDKVLNHVLNDVQNHGHHLATGNQCTKYLLEVLSERGHGDVACAIATQKGYPGWGYMIGNGATTVWERWENETGGGMNSHDHPMMGSVGAWFYRHLGGIKPDWRHPAFERFTVEPVFPRGLGFVKASLDTVRGRVVSEWENDGKRLTLRVAVPLSSAADIVVHTAEALGVPAQKCAVAVNGCDGASPGVVSLSAAGGALRLTLYGGEYHIEINHNDC